MNIQPFTPVPGATQTVSATQSNTNVTLTAAGAEVNCVRVANKSTSNEVFINLQGTASATADMVVLPGTVEVFSKGFSGTIGVICATGQTATVYITPGEGV